MIGMLPENAVDRPKKKSNPSYALRSNFNMCRNFERKKKRNRPPLGQMGNISVWRSGIRANIG